MLQSHKWQNKITFIKMEASLFSPTFMVYMLAFCFFVMYGICFVVSPGDEQYILNDVSMEKTANIGALGHFSSA